MNKTVPVNRPPLGVGSIIREMFSILSGNFVLVFVLAFLPCLLSYGLKAPLIGLEAAIGIEEVDSSEPWPLAAFYLSLIGEVVVYTIAHALIVQLVLDLKQDRPVWLVRYLFVTLGKLLPLVVLSAVVFVLFFVGLIFLIVPGIWVASVFMCSHP